VKNDQKLIKIKSKKWSKTVILNGKIEFFTKIHLIDTKNSEKSSKIDHKMRCQNVIKFDYQNGG